MSKLLMHPKLPAMQAMHTIIRELKCDVNGKWQTAKIKLSGICFKPLVQ